MAADDPASELRSKAIQQIPAASKWTSVWKGDGNGTRWKYDVDIFFRDNDRLEMRWGKKIIQCQYIVDSTASPMRLDITAIGSGETWHCIYRLKGSQFKLCWPRAGAGHPPGFDQGRIMEFVLQSP
jgi:uncharacterized protein (TIGR03067 family)